ncbi:hypothetical protein ACH41H_00925 [Streptomyces sp. NPDC020800]|uniref:hypothetical protein n=1 Tax=Streptomyces sp. NPDC020800 TaxID=3365092 RepID=UPI0037A8EBC8
MLTQTAYGDSRLSMWQRVREFAVPPSMIETATARRRAGDWAGACAAAGVDIDLDLRSVARTHGRDLAARIRADLRRLAPDLLRWHMPRIAPDGLLRPGLTLTLARYPGRADDGPVHLVARTPPAWADAGQRIGLTVWDGSRPTTARHPHPRPSRRYRLDLHRHLWDAERAGELRVRAGTDRPVTDQRLPDLVPPELGCATGRWAAEAEILLRREGQDRGAFAVRCGARHRFVLELGGGGGDTDGPGPALRVVAVAPRGHGPARTGAPDDGFSALPVLPDAATWILPDLELVRAGLLEPGRLHPLVAAALEPDRLRPEPPRPAVPLGQPRLVECRGARHRIGLVDDVLAPLDHDPDEIRREELLFALGGPPMPCLQAIDDAHRRPDCLTGVRERLDHGDTAGALAVVEALLGPGALLRDGPLRDALESAAERRIAYGLYRAGLAGPGRAPLRPDRRTTRHHRRHPRQATFRV